ncbi:MAG: hypothetical protein HQK84_08065 [Nitrospinae bacterium]|nr:hypothetical protein [Nitrospinota bacterium]
MNATKHDLGINPIIKGYKLQEKPLIRNVAILPIRNETKQEKAGEMLRKSLYGHFSWLAYSDIEFRIIDTILGKELVLYDENSIPDYAKKVGKLLNVDAVILGSVSNFDRYYAGIYAQIAVGARLYFVKTNDGSILWKVDYTERFHEGGIPLDPIGAIATMIKCGMALSEVNLIHTVNDFSKNVVETIPDYSTFTKTQYTNKDNESTHITAKAGLIEIKKDTLKKSKLEIESEVNMLVLAADKLSKEGKKSLAIKVYQEAVELKPQYTEIHFQLSLLHAETGNSLEALRELNIAIRQEPEYSGFYYSRGLLNIELLNILRKSAIQDFKHYQRMEPENAEKVNYLLKSLK